MQILEADFQFPAGVRSIMASRRLQQLDIKCFLRPSWHEAQLTFVSFFLEPGISPYVPLPNQVYSAFGIALSGENESQHRWRWPLVESGPVLLHARHSRTLPDVPIPLPIHSAHRGTWDRSR